MRKNQLMVGLLIAATVIGGAVAAANTSNGTVASASKIKTQITSNSQNIDMAYEENQEEEQYIAQLVSNMTNKNVSTSDWQACLEYLEANYDTLMANENLDTDKIESYVTEYQLVKYDLTGEEPKNWGNTTEEEVSTGTIATGEIATGTNNGYNVEKVKEYIDNYWEDYNTEQYPDFTPWGGDCANFVSQCLYAGGKPMKGTNASNFSNWFCRTNVTENFSKTSSTWRGAQAFAVYWKNNAVDYKDFPSETFESDEAFNEFFHSAEVGDAMSFFTSNDRAYHTVIIRHKDRDGDGTIRFAAHTGPQYERDVKQYVGSHISKVRLYKMGSKLPTEIPEYVAPEPTPEPTQEPIQETVQPSEEPRVGFWARLFGRR